jgi:S-formylglutathione hydrolase FrmB
MNSPAAPRLLLAVALAGALACGGGGGGSASSDYECFTVSSPAIADSQLENGATGQLCALLPASYRSAPERRYPVVYFLHGFDESPTQLAGWPRVEGGDREVIVVALQGQNALHGSFYVNSAVTGRFEDWVAQEAVAAVDARYRTVADRDARGLCGFSMGGFGAVNLALRHPDVFRAAFAMAGGFLRPDGLPEAMASWSSDPVFRNAYGATFAPAASAPWARVPDMSGDPDDLALQALWLSGFGDWGSKLDAYAGKSPQLAAIHLEWGAADGYPWIPKGSAWLAQEMSDRGLPVTSTARPGVTHALPPSVISGSLLPFFQEHLVFPE